MLDQETAPTRSTRSRKARQEEEPKSSTIKRLKETSFLSCGHKPSFSGYLAREGISLRRNSWGMFKRVEMWAGGKGWPAKTKCHCVDM